MAREGPYEIIDTEELRTLKAQVDDLKKRSEKFGSDALVESLSQLTKNMTEMMQVFKLAAEQIKAEDGNGSGRKVMEKLDKIIEQNQTIAEALVQMNDMITTDVDKLLRKMDQGKAQEQPKLKVQRRVEMPQPSIPLPIPPPQQLPPFEMPLPPKQMPSTQPRPIPSLEQGFPPPPIGTEPQIDMSDLENLPEMPPLELEEPKKGFFSKLLKKK